MSTIALGDCQECGQLIDTDKGFRLQGGKGGVWKRCHQCMKGGRKRPAPQQRLLDALEKSDYDLVTVDTGTELVSISRRALIKAIKPDH